MSDEHDRSDWTERLSRHVDGDLSAEEARAVERHLERCARCRASFAGLRDVRAAARALGPIEPPRDLWPAVAARLGPRRPRAAAAVAAAALLVGFAAGLLVDRARPAAAPAAGGRFVLVLHQSEDLDRDLSPAEHAVVVERYAAWARRLAADGVLSLGEKLVAGEGLLVRPGADPERQRERAGIGGLFILRAADYDEVLRRLRDCPHLRPGGWIEVRRIEEL